MAIPWIINSKYIEINGSKYRAVNLKTYDDYKYLLYRIKTVKQKIKTFENGTTGQTYKNYPILLEYLERFL